MTEDYKEKLIKYMTGNIEPETGANEPQFIDKGIVNQNIYSYLSEYLQTPSVQGTLQQENSEYILFYGYYQTDSDLYNGFIYITSKDLIPVSLITEYDSGTKFRPFITLNIDEDDYFYGIDNKNALFDSNVANDFRFIMLNKIIQNGNLTGNFTVKLRQSYFFNETIKNRINSFGTRGDNRCIKKIGAADYYFFVLTGDILSGGLGVVSLKINVGESNTWKFVTNNDIYPNYAFSIYLQYNNNFKIIISGPSTGNSNNYVEVLYSDGDEPSLTTQTIFQNPLSEPGYIIDNIIINETTSYIAYEYDENDTTNVTIYKPNYQKHILEKLYDFSKPLVYLGSNIRLLTVKGLVFFKYGWFANPNEQGFPENWDCYIGMIVGNNLYYIEGETSEDLYPQHVNPLYINIVYNLITLYSPILNGSQKIQLVFNQNNYNGLPYEDTNCLMPNSSILYDTDDNIIFARNLYNKTVLGATTTSTVQIPNTMLNDVTIGKNDLISETNIPLTEDTTDITKNIYETVNINFANSISIRNDNDPNNTILNPTASVRLNGSTTQNNNYDDVKATKVRVNYVDGTNMVISLNPSVQIVALTDTSYQYNFILQISKEINNIQIISNDELTIYQTIDNLTLEVGKTYNILQNVEVQ